MGAYKTILHIRKLHGELSQLVGSNPLKEVEKQAESIMVKEITATANQAIKAYPIKDDGRKHELRTALDTVLRKLADRIDRGFNVEIRIAPLPSPDDPAAPKLDAKDVKQHEERRAIIERAAKQLEFSYRGGTPILHLDKASVPDKQEPDEKPKRASRKSKTEVTPQ